MYVQSLSTGGTLFWKELHSTVTTNSFGLFNLVVGTGTRQTESTVVTFNLIDWSVTPKYLKTEIFYSGSWKDMGTSQLVSVPYALTAGDITGSLKKLAVEGETSGLEDALFEVKNKNGQTIFAVYNEGVRIYVDDGAKGLKGGFAVGGFDMTKATKREYFVVSDDSVRIYLDSDPLTKGKKSGFAVGGYDLTKGTVQNYLDVSGDSVRIYIDSDPSTKKLKGGFAVGGYDMTKGIVGDYFNVSGKSDAEAINGESRVLWYPAKEAFRSGNVLIESKDSVGTNSWASGYKSKAIGNWSQALGYQAIARKDYSTAIGKDAVANSINSFAFGEDAAAKNDESYAIGRGAVASGFRSFAFGSGDISSSERRYPPYASGDYSFALGAGAQAIGNGSLSIWESIAEGEYSMSMGLGSRSSGASSIALGWGTQATADFSIAIGDGTVASNWDAMAFGWNATASGENSTALGGSTASGDYSIAIGVSKAEGFYSSAIGGSKATGEFSTAIGDNANATQDFSMAFGTYCNSNGPYSQAFGYYTTASGSYSSAMGNYTTAPSGYETVIGRYNTTYTPFSTNDWNPADRLFVIGNGSSISKSDAFTVLKNGNVGIGTSTPSQKLHVNGDIRLEGGGIQNLSGGIGVGFTSTGWYSDVGNLATRIPSTTGDLYVQTPGGASTYLRVGPGIGGMELFVGKAVFDNAVGIATSSVGTYKLSVNGTAYSTGGWSGSDFRWKKNILPLNNMLSGIQQLIPVSFEWRRDEYPGINFDGGTQIGLVAQDVEKVFPELVKTDDNGYKAVSYEKISVLLLAAVKEQQQQIDELKAMVEKMVQKQDGERGRRARSW